MGRYGHLLLVWVILLVGAAATIGAAFVHGGAYDFVINLLIAAAMAGAVMAVYMRLKETTPLSLVFACAGFFLLLILLSLLASDYVTRAA